MVYCIGVLICILLLCLWIVLIFNLSFRVVFLKLKDFKVIKLNYLLKNGDYYIVVNILKVYIYLLIINIKLYIDLLFMKIFEIF